MSVREPRLRFGKIWTKPELIFPPPLLSPGNGSERSVALLRLLNISTDLGACSALGLWNSVLRRILSGKRLRDWNTTSWTCVSTWKVPLPSNCDGIWRALDFVCRRQFWSPANGEMFSPEIKGSYRQARRQ